MCLFEMIPGGVVQLLLVVAFGLFCAGVGGYVVSLQSVVSERFYERQYKLTLSRLVAMKDEVDYFGGAGAGDEVLKRWYRDQEGEAGEVAGGVQDSARSGV